MQVAQQRRGQGQAEGNQPDAAQRCQPGERAVELAVAGIEPGETGEEPAAKGFLAQPQGGEGQGVGQRRLLAANPARPDPGGQGKEEGDCRDEQQHQQAGQQGRGAAVGVNADVDPEDAGCEGTEAIAPAPA
ncbi:hypothetical protein D3C80_1062910 [compost metagenome]